MPIEWTLDPNTEYWAKRIIIAGPLNNVGQYQGREIRLNNWGVRLLPPWAEGYFDNNTEICSPERIIELFRNDHFLEGLVLTICWGTMWRTNNRIYQNDLEYIRAIIEDCKNSIIETQSIETAWELLTNSLGWSKVVSSKLLHFLCRTIENIGDIPVPIDNAAIIKKLWPGFKNRIIQHRNDIPDNYPLPLNWAHNDYESYNRYMTVIITWARIHMTTTKIIENWIFANRENLLFIENNLG